MSLVSERKEDNREMLRSLHIIMPMAGEGSRFLKEKYKNRIKTRKNVKSGINIFRCWIQCLSESCLATSKQRKGYVMTLNCNLILTFKNVRLLRLKN